MGTLVTSLASRARPALALPVNWKRRWLLGSVAVLVLFLAAGLQIIQGRQQLLSGTRDLKVAEATLRHPLLLQNQRVRQMVGAEIRAAQMDFSSANSTFGAMGPVLDRLFWVPVVGTKLSSARPAASVAFHSANAAADLMAGVAPIWPILAKPNKGHLLTRITSALQQGHPQVVAAKLEIDRASKALVSLPLSLGDPKLDRALARLRHRLPQLRQATSWLAVTPELLGATRPSHLLFAWENPAELRATGGFIGSSSFMTFTRGHLTSHFVGRAPPHEIQSVPVPLPEAAYTNEMYWIFADSNWSPDFPLSARTERWFYGEDTGRWADGVIDFVDTATPQILQAIGPVYLPGYHRWMNAGNVNALAQQYVNGKYWGPLKRGNPDTLRKQFLNATLKAALHRLQALPTSRWPLVAAAMANAIRHREVLLYHRDPQVERAIVSAGADGRILHAPGDYLYIVDDNRSYNKLNPYVQESARYQTVVEASSWLDSTLTLRYHVKSSPANLEGYGPAYGEWGSKHDYQDFFRVFVPPHARLVQFSGAQMWAPTPAYSGTQFAGRFLLKAGQSRTITVRYRVPVNLAAGSHYDRYRLTLRGQTGADLRTMEVSVRPAPGVRFEASNNSFSANLDLSSEQNVSIGLNGVTPQPMREGVGHNTSDPYLPFPSLHDPNHSF